MKAAAAALGGSIALSSSAAAATPSPSERLSERWWVVVQNSKEGTTVPTLFVLSEESETKKLEELGVKNLRTTTETASPAAHGEVPVEPGVVYGLARSDVAETVTYAPGANPFWPLEHYPDGVFPAPSDAAGYVSYDEFVQGVDHLADEHGEMVRRRAIGESPGWLSVETRSTDPNDVWVVELANDVRDREAFAEKEKLVVTLGIHGDERAGAEAGLRLLEDAVTGDAESVASALDDVALVFVVPNPDGWVAKSPVYVDGRFEDANNFTRVTGTENDPNRQYPTVGWIDPTHHPAEPWGRDLTDDGEGIDDDVPEEPVDYRRQVPGALAVVEHLRSYENVSWAADLHGMFASETMIELLSANHAYDFADATAIFDFADRLQSRLEDRVGPLLSERKPVLTEKAREMKEAFEMDDLPPVPTDPFAAGTIYDAVNYSTTGGLVSWLALPREEGGVGARSVAFEMAFDNRVGSSVEYLPDLVGLQVVGYQTAIETLATAAVEEDDRAVDAPDGDVTAFVTAESLGVSATDLPFVTDDGETTADGGSGDRSTSSASVTVAPDDAATRTVTVADDARTLSGRVRAASGAADVEVFDPEGSLVRTSESSTLATSANRTVSFVVTDPASGEWTLRVSNDVGDDPVTVDVQTTTVAADGVPNPLSTLGYTQRRYQVSPVDVVGSYRSVLAESASVTTVTPADVADGALDGVDNVVVPHGVGTDRTGYVAALDEFLAGGGDVVLTDAGVELLGALSNGPASGVGAGAVSRATTTTAAMTERVEDHPLLAGTTEIQNELAKAGVLGYVVDSAASAVPAYVVDREAFESTGGSVAGWRTVRSTGDRGSGGDGSDGSPPPEKNVLVGTLGGGDGDLHVVGSLLPTPSQSTLHPFGLQGHALSHCGYTVLANALGHATPLSE
jgi:hypothetical protein